MSVFSSRAGFDICFKSFETGLDRWVNRLVDSAIDSIVNAKRTEQEVSTRVHHARVHVPIGSQSLFKMFTAAGTRDRGLKHINPC